MSIKRHKQTKRQPETDAEFEQRVSDRLRGLWVRAEELAQAIADLMLDMARRRERRSKP